jgi:NAD(P)-dependent dehydrogenase (short-subunit alcohol dehydrogenase family)
MTETETETETETATSAFSLPGRTALITGGARGIGYTTASRLAAAGARVVIVDINEDLLTTSVAALRADGAEADGWRCDITDEADIVATVARVKQEYGVVDILVNNAGYAHHCPPEDMERSEWQHVIDACLTGTFLASKAVAKDLIAAGRPGAIINLSSIAGTTSLGRGIFAYGAAKAGIDGLTRDLAIEWASHGIRVNSVAPCQVRTEGFASVADQQSKDGDSLVDRVLRGIPLGRLAESIDIANAIQFLASDAAAMITGVVLPIDGGNLAMNPGATLRR